MLLDQNHDPANSNSHPSLCAYRAMRAKAVLTPLEPEALADELLGGIRNFSTPDSVNRFLGNFVKQLTRKSIARRDALALAYIPQLLLNAFPAMQRQREDEAMHVDRTREFFTGLAKPLQSANNAHATDAGTPPAPLPPEHAERYNSPPSYPIFADLQPGHPGPRG
jgi:hypothetical protein